MRHFLHNPHNLIIIFSSALCYLLFALAFPIAPGRDMGTYFQYFSQFFSNNPTSYTLMLYRTPGAPFFYGILNLLGGAIAIEIALGICFVIMSLVIFNVSSNFHKICGYISVLLLFANINYQISFHSISSDNLFSFGLVIWLGIFFYTIKYPSILKIIVNVFWVFILILIRPSSQYFAIAAFLPFLIKSYSFKKRLYSSIVFAIVLIFLLTIYSEINLLHYGDFTISRGTKATMPFSRVYTTDRIVRNDNGPYSKALESAIEKDLLQKEPYKTYSISSDVLFIAGSARMWSDLVSLSNRIYGWDSDYDNLLHVSIEAINKYPKIYLKGYLSTLEKVFQLPTQVSFSRKISTEFEGQALYNSVKVSQHVKYSRLGLAIPDEDDIIPSSYQVWTDSKPDFFVPPGINNRINFNLNIPPRSENVIVKSKMVYFYKIFRHFEIYKFILLAFAGLWFGRSKFSKPVLFFMVICTTSVMVIYTGLDAILEYRIPYDPIFYTLGSIGIFEFLLLFVGSFKVTK